MSPSLTLSHRQALRQSQELSLAQRLAIKAQQTGLYIELIAALREERYEPQAQCPRCGRALKPNEILAGFLYDVNDFTTACTGCHHRFEPRLVCFGNGTRMEIPFYCGPQAKHRLREVSHLRPQEIARAYPGEYRSAVVHFGTLSAMFLSLGITYTFPELEGWQAKVVPFLGRLPDSVIAKCVDVGDHVIRKLRKAQGIEKYTKKVALREARA